MYWILNTEEEVNEVKALLNILNDYAQKMQNAGEKSLKQELKKEFKRELKDSGPVLIFDLISRIGNQLYIPTHVYRKIISKNKDSIELNRKLAYEFAKKLIRDSAMKTEPLQELEMKAMNREELIIITTFIYMFYEIDNVKEVIKDTNEVAMIHIKKRFEITWKTKMYWKLKLVDILEGLKSK
ncbi:hypothetical protein CN384_07125 [Bacillus thuringiensis]|uniref:hypothetical protein n=1 Tax=Bacillus cereus group TaxID=86661 RepID=UPI000A3021EA|nr:MULTISPECIES: hypothetical protein [Bacillus cereus group]PES55663.1 hypothetical protein CN515_06565 [Bacillus cereus]PFA29463.1 hypothetical protein CN384_07125 [Bacillus thuringiensis]PGW10639.1 hypothetical protein COD97_17260 [Bacillus cereus]SME47036.1 hypothetical protein BACERE00183_03930 [Bacillus cereus]